MNIRIKIGNQIKVLREEKGLTQEQLSELSGIPRRTIVNIEQGAFNSKIESVQKLAEGLNSTLSIINS